MKDGSIIELYGRLHLDIFQQGKLLPPGLDLSLKLIPSDDKFVLLSSEDNAAYKYEIVFAELLVQTKQLNDALEAAQQAVVKEGTNMRIPYNRVYMKHYSIPTGLSTIAIDNVFTGALPDLAVIGLVEDEAFSGAYKKNPFDFKPFGLNRVELTRNGMKVPRFGYTPDFAKKLYTKDYANFLQQLNFFDGDRAINITPEEWADGYTLFSFKLTDGPIGNGVDVPRAPSHSGAARLELQFSAPTDKNLKVIVMYQMLGIIEIDKFNTVLVS